MVEICFVDGLLWQRFALLMVYYGRDLLMVFVMFFVYGDMVC